jgi:hypothetical protein
MQGSGDAPVSSVKGNVTAPIEILSTVCPVKVSDRKSGLMRIVDTPRTYCSVKYTLLCVVNPPIEACTS